MDTEKAWVDELRVGDKFIWRDGAYPDIVGQVREVLHIDSEGRVNTGYELEHPQVLREIAALHSKAIDTGRTQSLTPNPANTSKEAPSADRGACKDDQAKLRYGLIPAAPLAWLAAVLTYGAAKYAPHGWQNVPNAKERYLDALIRHIEALRSGEEWDPETGGFMHHCGMILCNAAFLCYFSAPRDLKEIAERTQNAIKEWKTRGQ